MSDSSGTALAPPISSGSTKTARDKNKKSENTPRQTSKQATMGPAKAGLLFFRFRIPELQPPIVPLRPTAREQSFAEGPMKNLVIALLVFGCAAQIFAAGNGR